jgi:ATP-dependent Zn protease
MTEEDKQSPPQKPSSFAALWAELKRRKVMRVAITYAVVAWIAIQVSATVFPQLSIPDWAARLVTLVLLIGFPIALIITWAFELSPDGIKTTKSAREEQGDAPVSKKQERKRNWFSVVFAAAVPTLIFGALALFFFFRSDPSASDSELSTLSSQPSTNR